MNDPSELKFTATHEWVRVEGPTLVVGVSDYAQHHLSDIIHVELPEPGEHHFEAHEDFAVLESLRTASDFHAPVAGKVVETNIELLSKPELINSDPYEAGWLVKMIPDRLQDVDDLMEYHEYEAILPEENDEE